MTDVHVQHHHHHTNYKRECVATPHLACCIRQRPAAEQVPAPGELQPLAHDGREGLHFVRCKRKLGRGEPAARARGGGDGSLMVMAVMAGMGCMVWRGTSYRGGTQRASQDAKRRARGGRSRHGAQRVAAHAATLTRPSDLSIHSSIQRLGPGGLDTHSCAAHLEILGSTRSSKSCVFEMPMTARRDPGRTGHSNRLYRI